MALLGRGTLRSGRSGLRDRLLQPLFVEHACEGGAASGFFGIGGGFLIVPGLMLATGMPMINAIGTSRLSVGAFGLATALNYASSGLVDWWLGAEFIGGGIVGGLLGMLLATRLSALEEHPQPPFRRADLRSCGLYPLSELGDVDDWLRAANLNVATLVPNSRGRVE